MHTINILVNDSFNNLNDLHHTTFEKCVFELDKVTEYCSVHRMLVYYDVDIYDEEIFYGTNFGNWLYDTFDNSENETEKSILREILDKRCSNDPITLYPEIKTFEICFYYVNKMRGSYVHGLKEWIYYRRILLTGIFDKSIFEAELNICFPELVFSNDIHTGLNSLNRFSTWVEHIVSHLSILNDSGLALFRVHGEMEAIKAIEAKLPNGAKCSGQNSNNREKLLFKFKISKDENILVDCYPHTKLISAYSDGRIYFRFKHDQIADGKKLIIGWIGSHRDD